MAVTTKRAYSHGGRARTAAEPQLERDEQSCRNCRKWGKHLVGRSEIAATASRSSRSTRLGLPAVVVSRPPQLRRMTPESAHFYLAPLPQGSLGGNTEPFPPPPSPLFSHQGQEPPNDRVVDGYPGGTERMGTRFEGYFETFDSCPSPSVSGSCATRPHTFSNTSCRFRAGAL